MLATDPKQAAMIIDRLGLKGTKLIYETTPSLGDPAVWEIMNKDLSVVGPVPVQKTLDFVTWNLDYGSTKGVHASGANFMCIPFGTDARWSYPNLNGGGDHCGNPAWPTAVARATGAYSDADYVSAIRKADETDDFGMIYLVAQIDSEGIADSVDRKQRQRSISHSGTRRLG